MGQPVAPHAGAWIETSNSDYFANAETSRPMRARGLKLASLINLNSSIVAPHAGAWIETKVGNLQKHGLNGRAPCGRVD